MNETKTAKKRPTITPNTTAPSAVDMAPQLDRPDWGFWRRRSYCRIWQAALLSLNVEPTNENRATLESAYPERFKEYRQRREIVIVNRGHNDLLPEMEHARAGRSEGDKYVELEDVLRLARHQRWSEIGVFELGMSPDNDEAVASSTNTRDVDEDELDVHELKEKGEKYALVRLGAVLKILESFLLSPQTNAKKYLLGQKLNFSALGEEMAQIIKLEAKGTKIGKNFGPPGNRRAVSSALSALKTFHTIARR